MCLKNLFPSPKKAWPQKDGDKKYQQFSARQENYYMFINFVSIVQPVGRLVTILSIFCGRGKLHLPILVLSKYKVIEAFVLEVCLQALFLQFALSTSACPCTII